MVLFIGGLSNVPTVDVPLPVDKVAHFIMYGILGGLVTWGWLKVQIPRRLMIALLLAMAVGVSDEIHQRWVANRTSDVKDWIADAVGITVAASVVLRVRKESSSNVV